MSSESFDLLNPIFQQTAEEVCIGLILLFSIVITFNGYRYLRFSMMFQSFMLGSLLGWKVATLLDSRMTERSPSSFIYLHLGLSLLFAFLFIVIFVITVRGMLFGIGFSTGIQVASVVFMLVKRSNFQDSPEGISIIVLSGLVSGMLSFCCLVTKLWHAGLTAWIGAYWWMNAFAYFIEGSEHGFVPFSESSEQLNKNYLIYAIGSMGLTVLGVCVQMFHTALHVHHSLDNNEGRNDDEENDIEDGKGHYKKLVDKEENSKKQKKSSRHSFFR